MKEDFIAALPESKKAYLVQRDGKWYYDLTKGVVTELERIGITQVEDCGIDTYRNPEYFSYRSWSQADPNTKPEQYSTFASSIVMKT